MTMPSLIANYKERVIVTQLKKSYSIFAQCIKMAEVEYGEVSGWPIQDGNLDSTRNIYLNYLKPNLNIINDCENSSDCFSIVQTATAYYTFTLNDGSKVMFDIWNKGGNNDPDYLYFSYGVKNVTLDQLITFTVDVNGNKKPNVSGKDIFTFILTQRGLIPLGADLDEGTTRNRCQKNITSANWCTAYMLNKY